MTAVEAVKTEALESRFVEAYERSRSVLSNGTGDNLAELREDAIANFIAAGFPAAKDEAWKYTNIRRKLSHPFEIQTAAVSAELSIDHIRPFLIDELHADRVVLVDGRFEPSLSDVDNAEVDVRDLQQALYHEPFRKHFARYAQSENDAFVALNTSFAGEGVALRRTRGSEPPRPVHIVNITTGEDRMALPRILVVVEEGAEMTVLETTHVFGGGTVFVNSVVEGFVGSRGRLDYYRLQDGGDTMSAVTNAYFYQAESSHAACSTITMSGDVIRNNVIMHPDGEHCESHLFGLFLGQGKLHIDNHTLVDHAKPDCYSNELYKGVLDGESNGVFNGRVLVRRDAQKTNAYQSNKSIVLSDRASMNAKPELEIYADDVKCSHGATTGRLDAESLFYLRSRGLTGRQARSMLLLAFLRDVVENVRPEALRSHIDDLLVQRFSDPGTASAS